MRCHQRSLVPAIALAATLAAPPADAQTGPFVNAQPWFVDAIGGGGLQRLAGNQIAVDQNRDGTPDATFDLPPDIQTPPSPDGSFLEDRLSPSQRVLYTKRFRNDGLALDGCPSGVLVYFHRLGPGSGMTLLNPGDVCLPAGVAIGPRFFDPPVFGPAASSTPRTAVLVTGITGPTFRQALLWVDLVNGGSNLDAGTYDADVEQTPIGVQFAPAGNAAFVRHGAGTAFPKYSLIDLCKSRVAGASALTTQDLPQPGQVTAHVVSSGGSLFAELRLDGTRIPGRDVDLDNCLGSADVLLDLGKSGPVTARSGQPFAYTLTVHNGGTAPATNVVLSDTVPAGTTYVFSAGTLTNGVVSWALGDLEAGATRQVQMAVFATCTATTDILNDTYSVRSTEVPPLAGLPLRTVCTPNLVPVLRVSKTGPASMVEGQRFDYTLAYGNIGTATATGVTIEDQLPAGAVFVSASAGGTNTGGGRVRWTIGNLAAGASGTVTVTALAGCGTPQLQNSQYFISSAQTGVALGSTTVVTNVTPGSTAPINVTVASVPLGSGGGLLPGDVVQHAVTLVNTANERRHGLRISIAAGRAARFDQVIDAGGGSIAVPNPLTLEWTGTLEPAATVTIVFTTRMDDCFNPQHVDTQLNQGQPIAITDVCSRTLGSAVPPGPFPLRHPVAISLTALGAGAPQPAFISGGRLQVGRADAGMDFQIALTNQVSTPQDVSVSLPLPSTLEAIGLPPFVAPYDPAAVYDEPSRTISWSGAIAPGQQVLITFRAKLPPASTCLVVLSLSGHSDSCTNLTSGLAIAVVPPAPTEPHVIGTDNAAGLWTLRPDIDTAGQRLLCFTGENYSGIGRAPNGDIWVAGLPSYRFNPVSLEFEVVTDLLRPSGTTGSLVDVAVDRTTTPPSAVFLFDPRNGSSELRRLNPLTRQMTTIRTGLPGMARIVVDRRGRIAGVTGTASPVTGARQLAIVNPADPAADVMLSDSRFALLDPLLLDLDADGHFLVAVRISNPPSPDTHDLVKIDADSGAFALDTASIDLLVPGLPGGGQFFRAFAAGRATDLFVGRASPGQLGVVRRTAPPTGASLALTPPVADIVFVDPAASPSQLEIAILETILVGDALDLLPGILLSIDETIVVDDDVRVLPGVLLQVQETIAVNDGLEVEVALHNTLIGVNVLVRLRDELTGLTRVQVLFPLVTRSGMTAFTTRMDGRAPPPGFVVGDPPIVYDVATTAGFEGMATVCLDLTAQRFTGPAPRIFHFEGTAWVDRTVSIDETAQLVCGRVQTFSPFALFQATDRTAPVTTVAASPGPNAAGWNRTDVALAFTASDPPNGAGIKRVQVSLSGAQTGTITDVSKPVVLSAEGATTVTYFAEDNAGNVEPAKTLVVRIDKTPPELAVQFDPRTLDLAVLGLDDLSGPSRPSSSPSATRRHDRDGSRLRTYVVEDLAGNLLEISMRVLPHCGHERGNGSHRLEARVMTLQYGSGTAGRAPRNEIIVTWLIDRHGRLTHVSQSMSTGTGARPRTVVAEFDSKRGVTTIHDGNRTPIARAGLVLLRLTSARGGLAIQY